MNIIIFSNEFFNISNFRYDLILKILKKFPKSKLIIVAKFDGYELLINKFKDRVKLINLKIDSRNYGLIKNIITLISIIKCLLIYRPKLVISYTIKPNFFVCLTKYLLKFNLISNITGLGDVFLNKSKKNKIIFSLYSHLLKKSDTIVCQNINDANTLTKLNPNISKKIYLIPGSGVNSINFKFKKINKVSNFNFTFIGRIIKEKGIFEFIHAAIKFNRVYPNKAKFLIIGTKYKDNKKFNDAFSRYINVSKIKYIHNSSKVSKYIADSTFIVLPSYREGLSKVLTESMSIGRPIITTDVPGCKELVKNNVNGFLIKKNTSDEIFKVLKRAIKLNIPELQIMGNKSYFMSKMYSEENINLKYTLLIGKYIN